MNSSNTFFKHRYFIISLAIILAASIVVFGMILYNKEKGATIVPKNKEATVFIATDIHLYSDNLIGENNKKYVKKNFTSDGRVQEYDYALVEALVEEVNKQKPDYLVLTGDLTFNGEKDSHLELVKLLSDIEETQVLVIPGNHDMYSLDAISVVDDSVKPTESITAEEFREIYSDFGYSGAYSYDETTLSYIYELADDKWALMLDTTFSRYNEEYDNSITGGGLEEPTLLWLEKNLQYAQANGISVVSFTHHNLLAHNELFSYNYTLQNNSQVIEIFDNYGVKLNFSGHLHIQSIKKESINGNVFYDVSGGSVLDYGNRYGVLDIYENCYEYNSKRITNVIGCENIDEYSFGVFCDRYFSKTVLSYQNKIGEEQGTAVAALLAEINSYYFDGSYEEIHVLLKRNKKLLKLIKENTHNYESSYVGSIINVENEDQHSLQIER